MEVIIQNTSAECCLLGAKIIAKTIREKPNAVLGLATGSTPIPLYKELIRMHQQEGLDFSQVTTFNLDEYVGLSPEHPSSYRFFMNEIFFKHINIQLQKTYLPNGLAKNIPQHCDDYEALIKKHGPIDIQLLGLGTDGHIGFNEPSSSLSSRTRIKTLSGQTLSDNKIHFKNQNEVPQHCITMGIGTIMEAKRCMLLAFGSKKADAVQKMIEGPVTAFVPATALQFHPSTVVLIDHEASQNLIKRDYYLSVFNNKPNWQKV